MFKKLFKREEKVLEIPHFESLEGYDVVIHIGAPKSGSSALQKFFLENRKSLEKEGFYYPKHGLDQNGISGGHSNFGLAIAKEQFDEAKKILENHINQAKNRNCQLLLSAESLFNHHEKLKEITKEYKCKIVVFFRDPLESIFSNYNQGVKRHFQTLDINTVCSNILNQKNNIFSGKIFEKWCDVFNKSNVTIIEYNMEYFKTVSIQEIFLSFLNISDKTIQKIKPKEFKIVNKSYNLAQLELKRYLNHVLDQNNQKLNDKCDWILQELSDKQNEETNLIDTVSEDIKTDLYKKYKDSSEDVRGLNLITFGCKQKMTLKQNTTYKYKDKIVQILGLIEYLEKNEIEVYNYIKSCINNKLMPNVRNSFEIENLAQWFEIPHKTATKAFWFNQNQLNNMVAGNYKEPDFLRDIAVLLKNRGDVQNAYKIISKALELRPNGPAIQKLKKEME